MSADDGERCWPGTSIVRSRNNGFTLGYGDTPHGFDMSRPVGQDGKKARGSSRAAKPFNQVGGTIPGLGRLPTIPTFSKKRA